MSIVIPPDLLAKIHAHVYDAKAVESCCWRLSEDRSQFIEESIA
jgi:hypothetical protein